VHADFEVLSGGTVIVPIYDAKMEAETLHGYKPNGEKMDQTIIFGAVDKTQAWYDSSKPVPKKAVYYILDSHTLKIKNSFVIDNALFHQADIRFHDANTFYIQMSKTIAKYVLE